MNPHLIQTFPLDSITLQLFYSCHSGDFNAVQAAVAGGAQINASDLRRITPLKIACAEGHAKIVRYLVALGADVNASDDIQQSPLHLLCGHDDPDTVEYLLKHRANVMVYDQHGRTPLYIACEQKQEKIAALFLAFGANVNTPDELGRTPLHIATQTNNFTLMRLLFEYRADPNIPRFNGQTPLHHACSQANSQLINMLLDNGADYRAVDVFGRLALQFALDNYLDTDPTLNQLPATIRHLLFLHTDAEIAALRQQYAAGQAPSVLNDFVIINTAITQFNAIDQPDLLIRVLRTAHVGFFAAAKTTQLFIANTAIPFDLQIKIAFEQVRNDEYAARRFLKAAWLYGIDIENDADFTPLQTAARHNLLKIADWHIFNGVFIDESDDRGNTPLHWACRRGHLEMAMKLLANGSDVDAQDNRDTTPLHLACLYNRRKIALLLIAHGANLQLRDADGLSALHHTCLFGRTRLDIALLLIAHGADKMVEDRYHKSPLRNALDDMARYPYLGKDLFSYFMVLQALLTLDQLQRLAAQYAPDPCSALLVDLIHSRQVIDRHIAYEETDSDSDTDIYFDANSAYALR